MTNDEFAMTNPIPTAFGRFFVNTQLSTLYTQHSNNLASSTKT